MFLLKSDSDWLIYSDYLEENGEFTRAQKIRGQISSKASIGEEWCDYNVGSVGSGIGVGGYGCDVGSGYGCDVGSGIGYGDGDGGAGLGYIGVGGTGISGNYYIVV